MSHQAVAWAETQRPGGLAAKAVLLALADAHNRHTGYCFPRVRLIADDLGVSERTVQRALAKLEEGGFVRRIAWARLNGSQASNIFVFPALGEPQPGEDEGGAHHTDKTSPHLIRRSGQPLAAESGGLSAPPCHPTPRHSVTPLTLEDSNLPPTPLRGVTPVRLSKASATGGLTGRACRTVDHSGLGQALASVGTNGKRALRFDEVEVKKADEDGVAERIRLDLASCLGLAGYRSWIEPLRIEVNEGEVEVIAPSSFHANYIRSTLQSDVVRVCRRALGCELIELRVTFRAPAPASHHHGKWEARLG